MNFNRFFYAGCLVLLALGQTAALLAADSVPPLINYQGSLTDANGAPLAGVKTMEFNLYDAPSGGKLIWGPQSYATVPLINGRFNVLLGATDTAGRQITTAFTNPIRYLSIKIEGNEILPRQQILSTPFAMQAQEATHAKEADQATHANEADHAIHADGTKALTFEMPAGGKIYSTGVMHIHGGDSLHLLNKNGVIVNNAWGGNGNLTVTGRVQNEQGKPAFLLSVSEDTCGWSHPYLGCPQGYYRVGRMSFAGSSCDVWPRAEGYENGSISAGWMDFCAAQ